MQEIILKIGYFERGLSKSLKKVNIYFFFWTQSLLMDKVIKIKKGLELVTSCSLGYKTSTEKFLYLLCIMWQSLMMYYEAVFELLQKLHLEIYGSQFMTHKLFHFHLSFWIWNIWRKKTEKFLKIEYVENEKSFLDEIKNIFYSFWRAIIWQKNKILIKNSRHKL